LISTATLVESVKDIKSFAQQRRRPRKFVESVDLILTLKDLDTKKQEVNINETVFLPNKLPDQAKVCVIASGDLALRARRGGADRVIEPEELDKLSTNKREAKKLAKSYQFFLAETSLMPRIGRSLGQYLGPRGRMPSPVPPNSPIEGMIARYRSAVRIRGRNQLSLSCKVGRTSMRDEEIVNNALSVISSIEKKLPQGERNIKGLVLKLTMEKPLKLAMVEG
jgi:large subunit ribosomal protein L1